MAKATKKSKEHPTPDEPTPSNTTPKRVKTSHHLPTTTDGKQNRWSSFKSSKKVQMSSKKNKKTLPSIAKGKMPGQTIPPTKMTKKGKGKELFGHYHRLMEEMSTGTAREPEHSSADSSSPSTSDQESQ